MSIRLHHAHQTRSMRSLWLLYELGVDFDVVVHGFDKTLRAPDYLALNPAGRVPALEIDGRAVFESGAICEVLCERFPEAGMGREAGHSERIDWLIWLHFAETISQHCAALTQQYIVLYNDTQRSPIITKLEAARLGKCFGAVEARLAGRDYLLDSGFCAADISVGQAIYMGRHFVRLKEFPVLEQWYERITARVGFVRSLPPDGVNLLYKHDFYEVLNG